MCESHRLIGRPHQCARCAATLLPGVHHATQVDCDAFWTPLIDTLEACHYDFTLEDVAILWKGDDGEGHVGVGSRY